MKRYNKLNMELASAVFRGKYINIYNNFDEKYHTNNLTSTLSSWKRRTTKSKANGKMELMSTWYKFMNYIIKGKLIRETPKDPQKLVLWNYEEWTNFRPRGKKNTNTLLLLT